MIADALATFAVAAVIVAAVRCLVLLARRDAVLAERDAPNARLLEPLPRPVSRRWASEEEARVAIGLPPPPGRVVYLPGPTVIEAEEVSHGGR